MPMATIRITISGIQLEKRVAVNEVQPTVAKLKTFINEEFIEVI